jgi:hypothetical protein
MMQDVVITSAALRMFPLVVLVFMVQDEALLIIQFLALMRISVCFAGI